MAVIAERTEVEALESPTKDLKDAKGARWGSGVGERHTWPGRWLPWHRPLPWIRKFLCCTKNLLLNCIQPKVDFVDDMTDWYGVELDQPLGRHDGTVQGVSLILNWK